MYLIDNPKEEEKKEEIKGKEELKTPLTPLTPMMNTHRHPWVDYLTFIRFDINEGQVMDYIFPRSDMSQLEKKTICMMSFPDSNSFTNEGELKYVFKFKRSKQFHH